MLEELVWPCNVESHDSTPDWLAARRSMVGASESAALFGEGYANQSALTVWASKVHGDDGDAFEPKRLKIGKLMEPALRAILAEEIGFDVESPGEFTIFRHAKLPWIGATLDAVVEHPEFGPIPAELKNVGQFMGKDWQDGEAPLKFLVQASHQMLVTGASHCYLFGLIGGNEPQVRLLERNDRFIATALMPKLQEFWAFVEAKAMPPVDGSEATGKLLARLWQSDDGSEILLPDELADAADRLAQAKADAKDADEREQAAKNQLMAALGEATFGRFRDGRAFSWKWQDRKAYEVKASRTRIFRSCK